jgi:hypothetical protein
MFRNRFPRLYTELQAMKTSRFLTVAIGAVAIAGTVGCIAKAQEQEEDKYSLEVPGGLAFAEFKGYEDWAVVSVHRTEDLLKVVVANPVMMDAYRHGIPANGQPVPDGARMAKVEWKPRNSAFAPYDISVPGSIYDLDFMVKDSKRFAASGGWGYAVFVYDSASAQYRPGTLAHRPPQGNDASCGFACHTIVSKRDYVFTEYADR